LLYFLELALILPRCFEATVFPVSSPKPVSVQVVERVGLLPFSFQFFTRLAAVF